MSTFDSDKFKYGVLTLLSFILAISLGTLILQFGDPTTIYTQEWIDTDPVIHNPGSKNRYTTKVSFLARTPEGGVVVIIGEMDYPREYGIVNDVELDGLLLIDGSKISSVSPTTKYPEKLTEELYSKYDTKIKLAQKQVPNMKYKEKTHDKECVLVKREYICIENIPSTPYMTGVINSPNPYIDNQ